MVEASIRLYLNITWKQETTNVLCRVEQILVYYSYKHVTLTLHFILFLGHFQVLSLMNLLYDDREMQAGWELIIRK